MHLIRRNLIAMMFLSFWLLATFGIAKGADSQEHSIKIRLSYKSKSHGNFDVKKFKLNHPIKISHQGIINHLVALKYKGAFLGNKEEPVFSKPEVTKLAPLLMKKFADVNPEKIIHLDLKRGGRVTSGDIFSFKKYLNWRFDSINGETFFQKNNVRRWNVFAWKMVPQKGQLYFKSGADRGKRLQRNWIVANLLLSFPEDTSETSKRVGSDSSVKNFNPVMEKKLEYLKYLYNKKLLNDEEYKTQKEKLFDELF